MGQRHDICMTPFAETDTHPVARKPGRQFGDNGRSVS
jgi:hypothetical protein